MATADRAFINAEQRAFDWLRDQLADIDGGVKGYLGEMPIVLGDRGPIVNERQMWMFKLTNQTDLMGANVNTPVHCHKHNAMFRGFFDKRETALLVYGRLRSILPAGVASTVQRLDLAEGGQCGERDTVELSNDQDQGGLIRVWLVEQPLWVQFSNDDEQLGYEGDSYGHSSN